MSKSERFKNQVESELKTILGSGGDKIKLNQLMQKVADRYVKQSKLHVLKMKAAANVIVQTRKELATEQQEVQLLITMLEAVCPGLMDEPTNAQIAKQVSDLQKILTVLDNTFGSGDADG